MKNYRMSDYAYNKACKNEIVYRTVSGEIIRLNVNDFANEEEFRKWKEYSDEDYHTSNKADDMFSKKTACIDFVNETDFKSVDACDVLVESEETNRFLAEAIREYLKDSLSDKQLRRLILDVVYNVGQDKIAELEGCTQSAIAHSLADGKKRAKKHFEKMQETDHKTSLQTTLCERVSFIKAQHAKEIERIEHKNG